MLFTLTTLFVLVYSASWTLVRELEWTTRNRFPYAQFIALFFCLAERLLTTPFSLLKPEQNCATRATRAVWISWPADLLWCINVLLLFILTHSSRIPTCSKLSLTLFLFIVKSCFWWYFNNLAFCFTLKVLFKLRSLYRQPPLNFEISIR